LITFVLAVIFLAVRGLNLGVDFRGGTVIEIAYPHAADISRIRGVIDKMNLGEFAVQSFGSANSALIRLPLKEGLSTAQLSERVLTALKADDAAVAQQARRIRGAAGRQGTLREWCPRAAAGVYRHRRLPGVAVRMAVRGIGDRRQPARRHHHPRLLRAVPVGVLVARPAAVLAVLGYSVNESVVIADRIRENFRKMRKASVPEVINSAITSTPSRTIITHGCTLMMVLSILFSAAKRCTISPWRSPSASASVSTLRRW
jgi:preprotein translocase subunit SecF